MKIIIIIMAVILTCHNAYSQTYIEVFGIAGETRDDFMMVAGEVFFEITKDENFSQGFISVSYEIEVITDVNEVSFNNIEVKVYPNPTSDFVSVAIPVELNNNAGVRFYDLSGRVLFTEKITSEISLFNLQNYNNNIIIMTVFNNNKVIKSYRIQVINK